MNVGEQARKLSVDDGQPASRLGHGRAWTRTSGPIRARISNEIRELLRATHDDLYGRNGRQVREWTGPEHDDQVSTMLEAVFVDPSVHTDLRMRLHREIAKILGVGP